MSQPVAKREDSFLVIAGVRLTLTAFLLYFGVWKHSHWSVATTLILCTLSLELVCVSLRKLRSDVAELRSRTQEGIDESAR